MTRETSEIGKSSGIAYSFQDCSVSWSNSIVQAHFLEAWPFVLAFSATNPKARGMLARYTEKQDSR